MATGRFGCNDELILRRAGATDLDALARLAFLLWPKHDPADLAQEIRETLPDPGAAFFLCFADDIPVGFAQCQLRRDYVEGTKTSPVGYLEGVFVMERYRNQGAAKSLLRQCELWCLTNGCTEFASDCEITNEASYAFHTKAGFQEVNRIVCFVKRIKF